MNNSTNTHFVDNERALVPISLQKLQRRQFLRTAGGLVAGVFGATFLRADELPQNKNPRAIFGDTVEPDGGSASP